MAKNVMSTGIYIVTDPNDNIEKLWGISSDFEMEKRCKNLPL